MPSLSPLDLLTQHDVIASDARTTLFERNDLPGFRAALNAQDTHPSPDLVAAMGGHVLVTAVSLGADRLVAWMLDVGANPNQRRLASWPGLFPLHVAAQHARADLVEMLLKHGADPGCCAAEDDMSPAVNALTHAIRVWGEQRLQVNAHRQRETLATGAGAVNVLEVLRQLVPVTPLDTTPIRGTPLLVKGANGLLDKSQEISTNTLAKAIWADHGAAVDALIKHGMATTCEDGRPLWRYALDGNRAATLLTLRRHRIGPPPDWCDEVGNTPLHLAVIGIPNAWSRWRPSGATLAALTSPDTVLVKNHAGQTPLDLLRAWDDPPSTALSILNEIEAQTLRKNLDQQDDALQNPASRSSRRRL